MFHVWTIVGSAFPGVGCHRRRGIADQDRFGSGDAVRQARAVEDRLERIEVLKFAADSTCLFAMRKIWREEDLALRLERKGLERGIQRLGFDGEFPRRIGACERDLRQPE